MMLDAEEFAAFFRLEFPRLVLYLRARGFDKYAEDAAEEAMSEAYANWPNVITPAAWVRTVALRLALRTDYRNQRRQSTEDIYMQQMTGSDVLTPEIAAMLTEQQRNVLEQLEHMPLIRRHVVALAFDGLGIREISCELAIAEATVRSHLRYARRALSATAAGTEVRQHGS